jgi:hypothetical protein
MTASDWRARPRCILFVFDAAHFVPGAEGPFEISEISPVFQPAY